MSGFFSKLFGGEKKSTSSGAAPGFGSGPRVSGSGTDAVAMVEETIAGVVENARFDLSFTVTNQINGEIEDVFVEFSGEDEEILTAENGELLDSFQLFAKRVLQHKLSDVRAEVHTDANGFREKATASLVELTEELKEKCLESGKSQYMRPLAPKDRKTVHQHLAGDERVRSRSIGEGHFKKVKIYPAKNANEELDSRDASEARDSGHSREGGSRGGRGGGGRGPRGNGGRDGGGPRGNGPRESAPRDGGNTREIGNTREKTTTKQQDDFDSPDENFGNR